MVTRVSSSLPAAVNQSRSYVTPLVAVLALAAVAYLLIQVAKSLMGRVLPIENSKKLHQEACEDFKKKHYEEALRKLTLALECKPDQSSRVLILIDRAVVNKEIKQFDKAIGDLTSALGCNPSPNWRIRILTDRATIYSIKEQYDRVIKDLTSALECNPGENRKAKILAVRADAYLASGKPEKAQADYDLALQCHPEDAVLARIYFARGILHANGGNHELAIEDYTHANNAVVDPQERAAIRYYRGCSYAALECYEEAIEDFTEAANACDRSNQDLLVQILVNRAYAYTNMYRLEDALHDYQLLLAGDLEEDQHRFYQMLMLLCEGGICAKNNDHRQAIEKYNNALEDNHSDPILVTVYFQRGYSNAELGNFDDAIRDLSKALEYDPPDQLRALILYRRGSAYSRQKKFKLCSDDLSAAFEYCPEKDRVQLLWTLGMARVELERYPEAIEDFTNAMDINPTDEEWKAQLLHSRGIAHQKNKKPDQARQDWEAALKCTFTKKGLRESIEADLNPKIDQFVSKISAVLDWAASKLPSSLTK